MPVITKSLIIKGNATETHSTNTVNLANPIAANKFVVASKVLVGRKSGGQ